MRAQAMDFSAAKERNIADPALWRAVTRVRQPQRLPSHLVRGGGCGGGPPQADMLSADVLGTPYLEYLWERITGQRLSVFKAVLKQPQMLGFFRARHMLEGHQQRGELLSAAQLANVQEMSSRAADELQQRVQAAASLYAMKRAMTWARFAAGGQVKNGRFAAGSCGLEEIVFWGLEAKLAMQAVATASSSDAAAATLRVIMHSPTSLLLAALPALHAQLLEWVGLSGHPLVRAAQNALREAEEEPDWQQRTAAFKGICCDLYHGLGPVLGSDDPLVNPLYPTLKAFAMQRQAATLHYDCSHVQPFHMPVGIRVMRRLFDQRLHGSGSGWAFFTWLKQTRFWRVLEDEADAAVAAQPLLESRQPLFSSDVVGEHPLYAWCNQQLGTGQRAIDRLARQAAAKQWSSQFDWALAKARLQPPTPQWGSLHAAVERAATALLGE